MLQRTTIQLAAHALIQLSVPILLVADDFSDMGLQAYRMIADRTATNRTEFETALSGLRAAFEKSELSRDPEGAAFMPGHLEQMRLAFRAAKGDQEAWGELKRSEPAKGRLSLYEIIPIPEAAAELANLAKDPFAPMEWRWRALCALGQRKDKRALEIGLTEQLFDKARTWVSDKHGGGLTMSRYLLLLTGNEEIGASDEIRSRFAAFKSIQEARSALLDSGIEKPSPKSSPTTNRESVKPSPELSPLPKKIKQPKPEKPDVAATPPPKPSTNNTGKLIAAATAIVGLLAVLLWFLRKK